MLCLIMKYYDKYVNHISGTASGIRSWYKDFSDIFLFEKMDKIVFPTLE